MPADKPTNAWVPEPEAPAEETTTEETPVAASKGTKGTGQTDGAADTTDPQEGAQAAPTPDTSPDSSSGQTNGGNGSTENSEKSGPNSEGSEETPAESAPVVVNDSNGQHVDMPDGSQVYTRSHTYPVSNKEWADYEVTHSGDQNRYSYVPGDKEYSAYSDPHVPNSHLARLIETEIASFAERVLKDPEAVVSNIWTALKAGYDEAVKLAIGGGLESGKVRA